ncbi:MAG: phosphotransferase [bacterium]|nr:phosphotransferase [bacterium]
MSAADVVAAAVPLRPQVEFPADAALPDLPKLFDPEWVAEAARPGFPISEVAPKEIWIRQFSHSPGRTATVSYIAEWRKDDYIGPEFFAVKLDRGKPAALFQYPDDINLPGLKQAADPAAALRLVLSHVFEVPRHGRRILRVDMVRYRPGDRAVLRHRFSGLRFYVRVVRPEVIPRLLAAVEVAERSAFAGPRLAGCWATGGVLWLPEIAGANMRQQMRDGEPPETGLLLDGLESLWALPAETNGCRPFDLAGAYRRAERTFRHVLWDDEAGGRALAEATRTLRPFVESWQPTAIAHNDFYDDQMIVQPDGRVALVDLEEVGPGDPMLDIGNMLAHLRWADRFGTRRKNDASGAYHHRLREAALDRFAWDERELALREAVCIFRVCTNTVRHPKPDWQANTIAGLDLVNETLP